MYKRTSAGRGIPLAAFIFYRFQELSARMSVMHFPRWILNLQITEPASTIVFTLISLAYIIKCIHKSRGRGSACADSASVPILPSFGGFRSDVSPAPLEPGDHISTHSMSGALIYSHHGIYEGDGMVIHYTNIYGSSSWNETSSSLRSFNSRTSNGRSVQRSPLLCFLGSGTLFRFDYGVTKPEFAKLLWGGIYPSPTSFETFRLYGHGKEA
ncbi:hypothetical protein Mapa_005351 [Marchantia paleacea]|nr:hypothetical protein Mapa_005351 [Marchantia paleacea]